MTDHRVRVLCYICGYVSSEKTVTHAAPAVFPFPEEYLRRALRAVSPEGRMQLAQSGLDESRRQELTPDTHVLLLRQVYLAHLEMGQLDEAAAVALEMASVGPLRDVSFHDAARVFAAMGDLDGAIEHQRLAARAAPAERRSFHLWSLATLQHFAGRPRAALATLRRAERWATRDRALLRAHEAHIRLDRGELVEGLGEVVEALSRSRASQGYGGYLLGMIAYQTGDRRTARVRLRAFLNRHASADAAQAMTLREELRRARVAMAELESV